MISSASAFHTAIYDALCSCLSLDKTSDAAAKLIREAYTEPENQPTPPRNRNVIYWTVIQDPAADSTDTEYNADILGQDSQRPKIYTTLKYLLVIVCYGPASEEYAHRIRHMLFLDGYGFPRRILRDAGIFPVPDPPQPSLTHEEEGSLWRRRADLTVSLRVRHEEQASSRNTITSPAAVIIRRPSKAARAGASIEGH